MYPLPVNAPTRAAARALRKALHAAKIRAQVYSNVDGVLRVTLERGGAKIWKMVDEIAAMTLR
jgi:hypothetical protein